MSQSDRPGLVTASHSLPLSVRIAARWARSSEIDAQLHLAARMGARLDRDVCYRTSENIKLSVDPQDPFQVAMAMGLYSRHATWTMRRFVRAGTVTIDAGAHLGYFSLLLARLVGPSGQVHAFEPDPRLYSRLAAHVAANRFSQVTANQCGLLDRTTSEARLGLHAQLGWSSMISSGPSEDAIAVPATTIDTYVEQHEIDPATISFVKIDVEGAEPQVLLGALETLARAPSVALLIEWVPERFPASGHSQDEVASLLRGLGFAPHVPVWRRRRHQFKLVPGSDPGIGLDLLFMRPAAGR